LHGRCLVGFGDDALGCFRAPLATTDYIIGAIANGGPISGSFSFEDGSPCGTINEFFGVKVTATATLLDASDEVLAKALVNEFGDYSLPFDANAVTVLLRCENAKPLRVRIGSVTNNGTDLGKSLLKGVKAPTVLNMTATLHGHLLQPPIAKFLPPPSGFPSDILERADGFLGVKGVDSRRSACEYYKAIGAVKGCDEGELSGAISFENWQRAVKIGPVCDRRDGRIHSHLGEQGGS
jgi:hypothetical protein